MRNGLFWSGVLFFLMTVGGCTSQVVEQSDILLEPKKTKSKMLSAAQTSANLGLRYLMSGDLVKAKASLLQAMRDDPQSASVWYSMGYYQEATGDVAQAETDYRRAIALAPHSGEAINDYGTFLCRQGRYQEAITQFSKAVLSNNYLYVAEAYENAGLCALLIPDKPLAKNFFLKAIDHNPALKNSVLELAQLYFEEGNSYKAKFYLARFDLLTNPTPESRRLAQRLALSSKGFLFEGRRAP
ncbi:MAG: type IV pilus biogenesis/stability protein PilW [Coxiella sp. RIFCSPHIGHO2_12_FULL_42_15]|nr:MAG: type IV pilus biogenesis/stability protein PilW [Coxiella sp. RIFCSPHIGHO2_12_FULL_42_15]